MRIRKTKLDEIQQEEVVRLYKEGYGTYRIAKLFSVSAPTVLKILKRKGVSIDKRRGGKMTEKEKNILRQIIEEYKTKLIIAEQKKEKIPPFYNFVGEKLRYSVVTIRKNFLTQEFFLWLRGHFGYERYLRLVKNFKEVKK